MATENTTIICESVPDILEKKYTDGAQAEGGKRLFTQRELEKCIGERLMRERRNNSSLQSIKNLVDGLCERGIINADSYAEAEKELCEKLCSLEVGNAREENPEGDDLSCVANSCDDGNSGESVSYADASVCSAEKDAQEEKAYPEALMPKTDNSDMPKGEDDKEKASDTQEAQETQSIADELCLLYSRHPSVDVASLLESEQFRGYCTGRSGTLCELYEGFTSLLAALESFNKARLTTGLEGSKDAPYEDTHSTRHAMKALSSTGFSRQSASESSDFSSMLSPSQRDIARRAGISYREYAQLLCDIPDGSRIKKHHG